MAKLRIVVTVLTQVPDVITSVLNILLEWFKFMALVRSLYNLVTPVLDPRRLLHGLCNYPRFFSDLLRFRILAAHSQRRYPLALWPTLHKRTIETQFDPHYCYLAYWATRMVLEKGDAVAHVDVGGQVSWLMGLAASAQVTTVDIRPFAQDVPSLTVKSGSLMALPYDDQSLRSLSCLHVVEHVGLGRYGDPLNPDGCWQAMRELARVVAPAGRLIFAVPCGQPRVQFNAHRVFAPQDVIDTFAHEGLELEHLAGVTDDRHFHQSIAKDLLEKQGYGCGFFLFRRPG